MLKKSITYTDYNGVERNEELYFNLTKNEILELSLDLPDEATPNTKGEITTKEDILAAGEKIYESLGKRGLYEFAKKLILKSYGIKTADGKGFKKNKELAEEFENTIAFDTIFMELIEDNKAFREFMVGLNPSIFAHLNDVAN